MKVFKNLMLPIACATILSFSVSATENLDLYNYKSNGKVNVDLSTLTKEQALEYLPASDSAFRIFKMYMAQGKPVGLSLISTLVDFKKAASKTESSVVKMFNFKEMKNVFVDLDHFNNEVARNFIPQSKPLLELYDFYYKETNSPILAVSKTLKEAKKVLNDVGLDGAGS
jgi:hypothetical protein